MVNRLGRILSALLTLLACSLGPAAHGQDFDGPMARRDILEYNILPSDADPGITRFN